MNEIKSYCGMRNDINFFIGITLLLLGGVPMLVFGIVSIIDSVRIGSVRFMFMPMILSGMMLLFGILVALSSPEIILKLSIIKIKRQGRMDEVIDDFRKSKSIFEDSLRLGDKYIFGNSTGRILALDDIKTLRRQKDITTSGGSIKSIDYSVVAILHIIDYKICYTKQTYVTCDSFWKEFSEEIKWRNPNINIIPELVVKYHDKSDAD